MKTIVNVRREFFKKLIAGAGALWFLGRTEKAIAESGGVSDEEKARRLALCREHFRVEAAEAHFANLPEDDVNNPHFAATMNTLVAEPKYIHNGLPRDGHNNILNGYTKFFTKYDNVFFEEKTHFIADNAIVFEVVLNATERISAKSIALQIMVAFVFDKVGGQIAGEHIYFDTAQLVAH